MTFDTTVEFEPTVANMHLWATLANMLMERAFEGGVRVVPREQVIRAGTAASVASRRAWLIRQRRDEGWCHDGSTGCCLVIMRGRLDEHRRYMGGAVK